MKKQSRVASVLFWAVSFSALAVSLILCVALGSVKFTTKDIFGSLLNALLGKEVIKNLSDTALPILWTIRAPRVLLAALSGASLSVAGCAMQGLIKNPLADGSTLGVTAGGTLGAVLFMSFGLLGGFGATGASIVFSFVSLLLILWFSHRVDANLSSNTIIMSGIIFSMLASSICSLIIVFTDDSQLRGILFWTMGSFSGRGWQHTGILAVFALIGVVALLVRGRELDAFAMGEEQAAYSGVDVKRARLWVLLGASVLCGASVAVAGSIAFIGLIIPHMARMVVGPAHAKLLPASAVWGATFLALCDLLARTVIAPMELPIGIVTSVIGACVFIYIFYSKRAR